MKLTSSAIMAVLVLSCAAAFGQTTVKLGFLNHDKQTQYCDFEQLTVEKNTVVTGTHFQGNSPGCVFAGQPNGVMAGVVAEIPATSHLTVTGMVATFADNSYDEEQGYMGACQCSEYYISRLRPSTSTEIHNNVFGWALYTNFGGTAALQNFGFTTRQLGNNDQNSQHSYDLQLP
jgi:hypothetical protein